MKWWARYEGGTRLYGVTFSPADAGPILMVRANHTQHFAPGDRVRLTVGPGHPLALFPASAGAEGYMPR